MKNLKHVLCRVSFISSPMPGTFPGKARRLRGFVAFTLALLAATLARGFLVR